MPASAVIALAIVHPFGGIGRIAWIVHDLDLWYAELLLEMYFEKAVSPDLWKRYFAMKCASLLREAMWSMVSEIHSTLDFDYVQYTSENLDRFEKTYANFNKL